MRLALTLLFAASTLHAAVVLTREGNVVHIAIDGQPFSDFYFGPDAPKPYLHPLRSASGKIVTRRFPMEMIDGETHTGDQHHRGLWLGFKLVGGADFWENEFSYKNAKAGVVTTQSIDEVRGGEHTGVIAGKFVWSGPGGGKLLEENRRMTISEAGKLRMVDVDITLTALNATAFGDSKDGAFSVRVAEAISERKGGVLSNSEGGRTMAQTWGKPASWVDYSGAVDGEALGVAMFEHPSSFHHPSRWHVRDYGLLAINPFGRMAFDKSLPEQITTIEKGQSIHLRYRVVIHPRMSFEELGELYRQYSAQ